MLLARIVDVFGVGAGINHRGQSANQVSGVATNYQSAVAVGFERETRMNGADALHATAAAFL
jgi:hypothetical protein